MKYFLGFFLFFNSFFPLAQALQITEIQPHRVGENAEWFEIYSPESTLETILSWGLSGGKTIKPLSDFTQNIIDYENGFFTFDPSPITLPDKGGTLQIYEEEHLLHEVTYPASKSGKRKDYSWSEILNWDSLKENWKPLLFHADQSPDFKPSKGQENQKLPHESLDYQLYVSEASPIHKDQDFIELQVLTTLEKVNLKYVVLKHNGTKIWHFTHDFWVKNKDFLVFYLDTQKQGITQNHNPYIFYSNAKSGLSGGSGSIEVWSWYETHKEKLMDFLCWKKEKLSKTEAKRVHKFPEHWKSACFEIKNLTPNTSVARKQEHQDTQHEVDFFQHFHGSPGRINKTKNQDPIALIEIQGSQKNTGAVPFSLNLNGEKSSDPDGDWDIVKYRWTHNGLFFSDRPNPKGFSINHAGNQKIQLEVTDANGQKGTHSVDIFTFTKGGSAPSQFANKNFKKEVELRLKSFKNTGSEGGLEAEFFTEVLANKVFMDALFSQALIPLKINFSSPSQTKNKRKIILPPAVKKRVSKNLGFIFVWREALWEVPTTESPFGVAVDQNWSHFALRALEF